MWDLPTPGETFGGETSHACFKCVGDAKCGGEGEGDVVDADFVVGCVMEEFLLENQVFYVPLPES